MINEEGTHKVPQTIKIQNLTLIRMCNSATSPAHFLIQPITPCALLYPWH